MEQGTCVVCQRPAVFSYTHPICKNKYTIDGVFSSVVYTGVVKKLIYTFKYKPYLTQLSGLLTDLFYEGLIQKESFMKQVSSPSIFIPIPLHRTRFRNRGYNQSQLLAKGLEKKFGITVVDGLERVKKTKTQVGLSQTERQDNIKDAFMLKEQFILPFKKKKQVFLVDDVSTSGATLREAAKVLKKNGVEKVWGITLAHGL